MPAMHDDVWDDETGDWKPDEWDRKVHAVLAWRDRVADSVDGPLPEVGSPEWAAADERTQAASHARHERAAGLARGRAVSDRMAAEAARRAADRADQQAIAAEWARRGYGRDPLATSVRAQREAAHARRTEAPKPWDDDYTTSFPADPAVPAQRTASDTRGCVQRAATAVACAAAGRAVRAAVTELPRARGRVDDEVDGHADVHS
ncbi:hypothetical protein [Pseudonocardia zijingensis]|uniref:Uncharacterized protein n=1 Tax=Pseudonocardia zijingensis TaxID=153376 RepID=A0ABN1N8L2_9PSEU